MSDAVAKNPAVAVPTQVDVDVFVSAAENGNESAVREWLALYPAIINMKHSTAGKTPDDTTFGSPALVRAAHAGKREMVELLLDNGADIEQRGGRGWTALAEAANAEHLEIVSLLAVRGADVNARFKSSWTALMWVAREGNLGAVKLLLEKGADPDLKSEHRITAITLANQMGRTEVVEFLLEWPFHVAEVAKKKAEVAAEELQVKRAAAHLEKLKSRRPKQSPFGRGKP